MSCAVSQRSVISRIHSTGVSPSRGAGSPTQTSHSSLRGDLRSTRCLCRSQPHRCTRSRRRYRPGRLRSRGSGSPSSPGATTRLQPMATAVVRPKPNAKGFASASIGSASTPHLIEIQSVRCLRRLKTDHDCYRSGPSRFVISRSRFARSSELGFHVRFAKIPFREPSIVHATDHSKILDRCQPAFSERCIVVMKL
jgi:hypothetical protein